MVAAILGGAAGPWITGAVYDATGTYSIAFWVAAGCSLISILAIWLAAPRKVRAVAGRAGRLVAS
jgi:cyanate permease